MKSKIEQILYKHSERVGLYEGGVITCIDENEFDDVALEIVKLFSIPVVIDSNEQKVLICNNCKDIWIAPELPEDRCTNCTVPVMTNTGNGIDEPLDPVLYCHLKKREIAPELPEDRCTKCEFYACR